MSGSYSVSGLSVERGTHARTWVPVAKLAEGPPLAVPLHVLHGMKEGPTLAVVAVIHGGEHFPLRVLWELLPRIDLGEMHGTILLVPVANPVGLARGTRLVVEDDIDFGNVNRVFPGVRTTSVFGSGDPHPSDRSLAEAIADTLTTSLLERADFALDIHCHQPGIGTVKIIQHTSLEGRAAEWVPVMCRSWGFGLINLNAPHPGTFSGQAIVRGIPACVAELGTGGCVSARLESDVARRGADAFENMLRAIGMVSGAVSRRGPQLVYGHGPHIRPNDGGYLISDIDPTMLFEEGRFGYPVKEGDVLGRVFNPYRLELQEVLRAPCDGVVYIARNSGPIEASGHAFAVASVADGRWEE